jgi:hypothetical protein
MTNRKQSLHANIEMSAIDQPQSGFSKSKDSASDNTER